MNAEILQELKESILNELFTRSKSNCKLTIEPCQEIPKSNHLVLIKPNPFTGLQEFRAKVEIPKNIKQYNSFVSNALVDKKTRAKINKKLTKYKLRVVEENKEEQSLTLITKELEIIKYSIKLFLKDEKYSLPEDKLPPKDSLKYEISDKVKINDTHLNEIKSLLETQEYKYLSHYFAKTNFVFSIQCTHGVHMNLTKAQIQSRGKLCHCHTNLPTKGSPVKITPFTQSHIEKKLNPIVVEKLELKVEEIQPQKVSYYLIPNDESDEIINERVTSYNYYLNDCPHNLVEFYPAFCDILLRTNLKLNLILENIDYQWLIRIYKILEKSFNLEQPLTIDYMIPIRLFDCNNIEHINYCWSKPNLRVISVKEKNEKGNGIRYQDLETIKSDHYLKKIYFDCLKLK